MSLTLHPVTSDSEFDDIIDCEWTAYETPYNSVWKFLYPVFGSTANDRSAAIQESKQRQLELHHSKQSSHWLKVTDDETGTVAGAAQWSVFNENPFKDLPSGMTCSWWPEGPKRTMVDEYLAQIMGPRLERMSKPHLCKYDHLSINHDYDRTTSKVSALHG